MNQTHIAPFIRPVPCTGDGPAVFDKDAANGDFFGRQGFFRLLSAGFGEDGLLVWIRETVVSNIARCKGLRSYDETGTHHDERFAHPGEVDLGLLVWRDIHLRISRMLGDSGQDIGLTATFILAFRLIEALNRRCVQGKRLIR